MVDIYGTIGPACADMEILKAMFIEGMTGVRLNTSHTSVKEASRQINMIQDAAAWCGVKAKILIDMQGPELRVGRLAQPLSLEKGETICLTSNSLDKGEIPLPELVMQEQKPGMEILLDDGKILLEIVADGKAIVRRGGVLLSGKSLALSGVEIKVPAMTRQDYANIKEAVQYGITGVMQPFVRNVEDLKTVRKALDEVGANDISLFAKIENMSGIRNLESFFELADEIVIARGDLGNAMPLWELPKAQKDIAQRCRQKAKPFMVVTQMLASMEHSSVPSRAEVSDIYNAVCDGASSVMVTGETAVGEYPVDVIRYLAKTVQCYDNMS